MTVSFKILCGLLWVTQHTYPSQWIYIYISSEHGLLVCPHNINWCPLCQCYPYLIIWVLKFPVEMSILGWLVCSNPYLCTIRTIYHKTSYKVTMHKITVQWSEFRYNHVCTKWTLLYMKWKWFHLHNKVQSVYFTLL